MPPDYFIETALDQIRLQGAFQAQGQGNMVGRAVRFQLFEKPNSLLRKRERCATVGFALNRLGRTGSGFFVGQIYLERLRFTRRDRWFMVGRHKHHMLSASSRIAWHFVRPKNAIKSSMKESCEKTAPAQPPLLPDSWCAQWSLEMRPGQVYAGTKETR